MWFLLALLAAASNAVSNVARHIKGDHANPIVLGWMTHVVALPLALVLVLLDGGFGQVDPAFWLPATSAALLTTITAATLIKAYQSSEVSQIAPLQTMLPIFLIVSSYLMLGERPPLAGMLGVVMVVAGAYYVNSHAHQRLLDPIRLMLHDTGARLILITMLIWSVSTNLDKIAVQYAPASFLVFYIYVMISLILTVYILMAHRTAIMPTFMRHKKPVIIIALFSILALYYQTLAIQQYLVSYVLAVKRTDVLMAVLLASVVFHEKERLKRLEGALFMVAGVVIIYLAP